MITLKVHQLKKLVQAIQEYGSGSQLQDVTLVDNYLLFHHFGKGPFTIGVELRPLTPTLGYFFGEPPKKKGIVKPIVLFLKAHARNLRLHEITIDETLGRVVRLEYRGTENRICFVELRLIPHGMNILIESDGKRLSLFPAKDLPPSNQTHSDLEEFDLENYLDQWMQDFLKPRSQQGSSPNPGDPERAKKKELEKRKLLLEKLEKDFLAMNKPWFQLGEFLKLSQTLEVPEEWASLLDPQLPVSANMMRCFDKYKLQEKRKEQLDERIQHIRTEILNLENDNPSLNKNFDRPLKSLASELLGKAKAKGRKLILAEGIEAVFGKSAKDNMALLRKAQAWDLWLHLRDLPGSHLIIRRPRQKNVDHNLMLDAARWLLSETIGKKRLIEGERYDVIMTECRHVKPIKGDRLGRVHFQNEITLTLRV